ncbi:MAG: T9SS type A sorting domain-containing protein, partial [Bacteroidota bacterium]
DVSTLELDSLSIYRLEGDVNFIFVGDEDSVEFRILTGTENSQQQNTVYPSSVVQSFQVLPSNFWDAVPNRPEFDVGGINTFPLDVPNPENLLDNANFFNNNTVFISIVNNDTAKDDSVFYVTGTENTGGGNNRLFYEQLSSSDNSVGWINSVLNFNEQSQTDADLYLIPYFALVKCAEDTTISRDESISYGDLTMYNIYPNPVQNQVNVAFEMNTPSDFTKVEIIDNNGRVVFETELGALLPDMKYAHTFDVGHLASGMYSVKLTTNNGGMGLRMVKQ